TFFNFIFLVISILLIVAGSYNSLTFLPVIFANTLIGIAQEIYAKNVLDKLSILNTPNATVIRDEVSRKIDVDKLVLGDVIILKSGAQIPADARVISGEVYVNESLLTGESEEIHKTRDQELMSGSFVVSGEAKAVLTEVGENSYINRLMKQAKSLSEEEQSEMVRSIDLIVKVMGILLIPLGTILFVQSFYFMGTDFSKSVTSMVAAVIGMVPEGLYLLVSVTLAMSAVRLAMKQVMLHNMKSIESLARVDVLCVDKTGTITDTKMLVAEVVRPDNTENETDLFASEEIDYPDETVDSEGNIRPVKHVSDAHIDQKANCATTKVPTSEISSETREYIESYLGSLSDDNMTMEAMRIYFSEKRNRRTIEVFPFSSRYKFSAIRFEDKTFLMGAPDILLRDSLVKYSDQLERYMKRGFRVLAFCSYGQGSVSVPRDGVLEYPVVPECFVLLQNPIRENAVRTFSYFKKQGVEVKVISGDNPKTVSEVAKQARISGAENYIDASTLKTPEDIQRAVREITVFGRVTPEQKRSIVKALKADGHTVAMTGDGVNDILAMKDADCSIAMASGSDAAVQSSQVVLLDSDFSHLPQIVGEGRRVINNIQRSASLFLVKNIFSVLLAVFAIINIINYPLKPAQITLISTFNIGFPAFFLALEPSNQRIKGKFIKKVMIKSLPAALTDFFAIAALVEFGIIFDVSQTDISVAATFLLGIVGYIILFQIAAPLNKYRSAVIGGCIAGLGVTAYLFNSLFEIETVSFKCAMLFALFAIATIPFMRYLTMFGNWIEGFDERAVARKKLKAEKKAEKRAEKARQRRRRFTRR
ncbi:MAG: HAD-IC family P-type ATPase, partial [Lachnospiraceae bacterium]|nr:HAD-IC family P-type ATPase [Lachnospiraceae bacterium]